MLSSNHLHFVITKYDTNFAEDYLTYMHPVQTLMRKFDFQIATFTFLACRKSHCITQEEFEENYCVDDQIDDRNDLSVGEDLESFLERIKNGVICKETLPVNDEYKESFNLCLLKPEEMVKLQQQNETFIKTFSRTNPDIPKALMAESESKKKFSKTFCWRKTCFTKAGDPNVNNPFKIL